MHHKKTSFHIIDRLPDSSQIVLLDQYAEYRRKISRRGYTKLIFRTDKQIRFSIEQGEKAAISVELNPTGDIYFLYDSKTHKFEREKTPKKKLILSTDLGGTLCGDTEATKQFNLLWLTNYYFSKENQLVYNTGRGLKSFLEMRDRESLLNPDWLITRCGCGIYSNKRGQFQEDVNWKEKIMTNWNAEKIKLDLKNLDWLEEKVRLDDEAQMSLKYILKCNWADKQKEFSKIMEKIVEESGKQHGIHFDWYVREKPNLFALEIIPCQTDKGKSLKYVLGESKSSTDHLIAFGDSMNDTGMLTIGNTGVLVHNSHNDVKRWSIENKANFKNLKISEKSYAYAIVENVQQELLSSLI